MRKVLETIHEASVPGLLDENSLCKSMDWFLYDNGLRHERVNTERYDKMQWVICFIFESTYSFNSSGCPKLIHANVTWLNKVFFPKFPVF